MVMAVKCLMRNLLAHSRPGAKEQHFIQQSQRNSIKKMCYKTMNRKQTCYRNVLMWCDEEEEEEEERDSD